ncbi:30S ribosomal protein S20 [Deferrisoma camini]|uniref:30S ribosomal protein S20 n=1 Tax=Deferrisoma camini TaxID=1035120 RepID=UPI00046D3353|nr:30S ribosomal protein S20 [Deferrisoma camini]
MANHKSALKKIKQDEKRRLRNKAVRTRYRNLIKAVRMAVAAGDVEQAEAALQKAAPYLHRAVIKGVIHRNKAARHISRLTRQVQALKTQQAA